MVHTFQLGKLCPNFRINPGCFTCNTTGCGGTNPNDCGSFAGIDQIPNVGIMRWDFEKPTGFDGSGTVSFHLDVAPQYINHGNVGNSNICPASSLFITPTTGLDITLNSDGNILYSGITNSFLKDSDSAMSLYVELRKSTRDNVNGGGPNAGDRFRTDCWTATMSAINPSGQTCYTVSQVYQGRVFVILPDGSETNPNPTAPTSFKLRRDWNTPYSGFIGIFRNSVEYFDTLGRNFKCADCDLGQIVTYDLSCSGIPYYWWNPPTYMANIEGFSGPNSSCKDCSDLNGTYIFESENPQRGWFGETLSIPFACACNKGTTANFANFCTDGSCLATSGCTDSIDLTLFSDGTTGFVQLTLIYSYYAGVVDNFLVGFGNQTCKYGTAKHIWSIPCSEFDYYGGNTLTLKSTTISPPPFDPSRESWVCQSNTSGCVPPGSITLDFLDWTR